jgi:Cof subfamily protein (haloacid dehalogenase superfamily)
VSDYTRGVLAELDRRGVPVVFVTGRPLRWTEVVFEYVGELGLAIVSNGGLVWDVARSAVHLLRPLDAAVGLEVCGLIREAVPGTAFAVEGLAGIALEPGFIERHALPEDARHGPLEELFDDTTVKLLARHEELPAQEFWDRVVQAVGDRVVVTWSSTSALLEISGAGVTKATTLALLCADHGIPAEDVIAFGDMPNDLPMLGWAGTSYAMADAHPTVAAAADHVAPGHDEDGVARVLAGVFDL